MSETHSRVIKIKTVDVVVTCLLSETIANLKMAREHTQLIPTDTGNCKLTIHMRRDNSKKVAVALQ